MRNFRLESVLKVRKHQEDRAQIVLAQSRAALEEAQSRLSRSEDTRRLVAAKLQRKMRDAVTISDVMIFQRYLERLSKEVDLQRQKVAEARAEFERRRGQLTEKMKDRKVIDRLREKQRIEQQHAAIRLEQAFINEAAVNRFARSR